MTGTDGTSEEDAGRFDHDWPRKGAVASKSSAGAGPAHTSEPYKPIDTLFGLKILVVGLGVLLLVAMITFFILLFVRGIDRGPAETAAPLMEIPMNSLALAPGEEITHMALDDGELALHLSGPEGERILLVNPYTADHKAVIRINPAAKGRE